MWVRDDEYKRSNGSRRKLKLGDGTEWNEMVLFLFAIPTAGTAGFVKGAIDLAAPCSESWGVFIYIDQWEVFPYLNIYLIYILEHRFAFSILFELSVRKC